MFADTSDTVPQLGDTMTHAGTPLDAEKLAAQLIIPIKFTFVPTVQPVPTRFVPVHFCQKAI